MRRIIAATAVLLLALANPCLGQSSAGGIGGGGGSANPYPGSDYATAARQDAMATALGAPADTAYAGSGNAGGVALGKGQYAIMSSLLAANGNTADAASATAGASGSQVSLLKALRDKLIGTNVLGKIGIDQTTPGTTNAVFVTNPQSSVTALISGHNQTGSAGGIANIVRLVSAGASNNPTLIRTNASRLYKITGYNAATSVRWMKLYNKASAPNVGTDTPFFSLALPPGAFSFDAMDLGFYFSTGIGYGLTTGPTDADTGALTSGDILNLNVWVF